MPSPRVTVVIPAHNRAESLDRAVRSVLAQNDQSFECIVVDDGSTQDLSSVSSLLCDHGHRWIRQSNQGVAAARNCGAHHGSAPWIAFLDSDDYWLPDKLTTQLAYHDRTPEIPLSQTAETWRRHGIQVKQPAIYQPPTGNIFHQCLERCCISCSSVMVSRAAFEAAGGFDTRYEVCEDYELWLRLTSRHQAGWIETPLTVKHAGHEDQLSKAIPAMDRFRLHALVDLWIHQPIHRPAITKSVSSKAHTLIQGASKRTQPTHVYQACLSWLQLTDDQASAQAEALRQKLYSQMKDPAVSHG